MKGTRQSLAQAIEHARRCKQGHLYRKGERYFFFIARGCRSPVVWRHFWGTVMMMDDEWGNDDTGDPEGGLDWLEGELTERGL